MTRTPSRRAPILTLCVLTTALCAACAARDDDGRVTVRDSAGVTIVESRAPQWSPHEGWLVSGLPLFEIGAPGTAEQTEFQRIDGARLLPDGRIVVADGGANTIRMFAPDGTILWTAGRAGDGPGEFRLIETLGVGPGDSVWVYDYGLRRFTILTLDGGTARTAPLGGALSAVGAVGRFPDGRFVVREFWHSGAGGSPLRTGLRRDPTAVALISADGMLLDTLAVILGREVFIRSENGRAVMSAPLFARAGAAAVHGASVVVGDQERFELRVYDERGTVERLIRLPDVDIAVTQADVERLIDEEVARRPAAERPGLRRELEAMDVPPTRPAFGDLLVDDAGNLWAAEYARWPRFPRHWTVLDPTGRWLGTVAMPDGFRPLHAGTDRVLGVWRDTMDVERVRVYALTRPSDGEMASER